MISWRHRVVDMLMAGIDAVEPSRLVETAVRTITLPPPTNLIVIAIGKAAASMATGFATHVGIPATGIMVAPEPGRPVQGFEIIVGEHPVPGEGSFEAGRRVLEAARSATETDTVLVLLSGGASALCEVPAQGVTPRRIADETIRLLASGLPIDQVNRARSALSSLKAGGLTAAARPARVVTLALSDVPEGSPATIGSGPSVGCDVYTVIGDGSTAAAAVAERCTDAGLTFEHIDLSGAAETAGRDIGMAARELAPGSAIIGHGETTVATAGAGHGGRNQELALAAALQIVDSDLIVAAIGTDGIDGPTANAGAVVDGATVAQGRSHGLDALSALRNHDSATFLEAVDRVIVTGPTGTNVADLALAVRPPSG